MARLWRQVTEEPKVSTEWGCARIPGIMESKAVQRRLAAILAADVAGYSRLMGVDEIGTLTSLKAHRRELTDPAIAAHRGRIGKTTGDGALIEFASVVDAVACAVAIQRGMMSRNADVDRKSTRLNSSHRP